MNITNYKWKKVGENDLEVPKQMLKSTKGKLNYAQPNTWMGYGILPFEEIMSIDILPYMVYGELIAEKNGGTHTIIIADDLLKYNVPQLNTNQVRDLGRRKRDQLETCKSAFGLDNIIIKNWSAISEDEKFQNIKQDLLRFYEDSDQKSKQKKGQPNYKEKVKKCLPKNIRDKYSPNTPLDQIPQAMYAIDEIAATIYMSENNNPIKIGHELEKSYDKRTLAQYGNGFEKELNLKTAPSMIYLHGGYTTDTQDLNKIMVPYITPKPENRVLLKDNLDLVRNKISDATNLYKSWASSILETLNPDLTKTQNLANEIYSTIVRPISGVKEYA